MKKIIKKVLMENLEDKKLQMAYVYLSNYLNSLEEVIKDNGRIYLRESGDRYGMVLIWKKLSKCWVDRDFWDKFSEEFSLQDNEVQSIITRWVEDTYKLKGIDTAQRGQSGDAGVEDTYKLKTNLI